MLHTGLRHRILALRASWHDARFGNDTPVEIRSTLLEYADGQPGTFEISRASHEKFRRADGWYCVVVSKPHGRSGLTVVQNKMVRSCDLPLLRWHGGGDHRGTEQANLSIADVF